MPSNLYKKIKQKIESKKDKKLEEKITAVVDQKMLDVQELISTKQAELRDNISQLVDSVDQVKQINATQTEKIEALKSSCDQNEIDSIRWEILQFARICKKPDSNPTQEEFSHIFALHDKYERMLDEAGLHNGQISTEYTFINNKYLEESMRAENGERPPL